MSLGPRLVIPGAIFASLLMTVLLLAFTAGVSYPQVALAAAEATAQPGDASAGDPLRSGARAGGRDAGAS